MRARFERANRDVCMRAGRRADVHGIKLLGQQHFLVILINLRYSVNPGEFLRLCQIRIAQSDYLRFLPHLFPSRQVFLLGDKARSDQSYSKTIQVFAPRFAMWFTCSAI